MTDPDHLKILKKLKRIENLLVLLIQNKQTDAIGQVTETRETDGSISEFAFTDEQACGCSQKTYYESLVKEEEKIIGPKKRRKYPHPLSPSGTKD